MAPTTAHRRPPQKVLLTEELRDPEMENDLMLQKNDPKPRNEAKMNLWSLGYFLEVLRSEDGGMCPSKLGINISKNGASHCIR